MDPWVQKDGGARVDRRVSAGSPVAVPPPPAPAQTVSFSNAFTRVLPEPGVDRRTIRAIAVGGMGILGVGLAAATLSSTLVREGRPGEGSGFADAGGAASRPAGGVASRELLAFPWLGELLYAAFALLFICLVAYVAANHRREAAVLAAVAIALGVTVWFLSRHVTIPIPEPKPEPPADQGGYGLNDSRGGESEGIETPRSPVAGLFLVVLAVVGLVLAVTTSATRRAAVVDRLTEADEDVAAIGRAAGRAADRLGAAGDTAGGADDGFENEVYRAWQEMTASLDVDRPESSTPGEFADAAVEAGMAPEDVEELTSLFEAVRYGGRGPTQERERRARELFRRIEATYAQEEDDP